MDGLETTQQNNGNMEEIFKVVGQDRPNYIKVIGIGGGGGNAVNHMMEEGIQGVDFILCNTDHQALMRSNVQNKVHLGERELGAGNDPNVGRQAAETSKEEINAMLDANTKMLFVTAGMGGGTGTGAAPVVAKLAKEKGILTVGIVTMPMEREGRRRKQQAQNGIEELRKCVDTLILISTDKLRDQYGDMKLSEAFRKADDVLTTAAKGIAEIITVPGYVNVDFEDVTTVMKDSGKAIMGSGKAEGEGRAEKAIKAAISSPLLNDSDIEGAKNVLLYITSGTDEVSLDEVDEILAITTDACGNNCDVIWGNGTDENLGDALVVTLIATGFNHDAREKHTGTDFQAQKSEPRKSDENIPTKKRYDLLGNVLQDTHVEERNEPQVQTQIEEAIKEPITEPKEETTPEMPRDEHQGPIVHSLNDDITEDSAPVEVNFTPVTPKAEPIATAPVQPQINVSGPSVKHYDNPFREDNDNDGFEITSRHISHEETETRPVETISATVLETPKRVIDPKDDIKRQRLKALSMNFRNQKDLEELEKQPAYLRRNVSITSDDSNDISRYSSSQNGISSNNSFLHDNVD